MKMNTSVQSGSFMPLAFSLNNLTVFFLFHDFLSIFFFIRNDVEDTDGQDTNTSGVEYTHGHVRNNENAVSGNSRLCYDFTERADERLI